MNDLFISLDMLENRPMGSFLFTVIIMFSVSGSEKTNLISTAMPVNFDHTSSITDAVIKQSL